MILVGNQRGGAKDLALHLLKEENDHVQVHELRGFASDNLRSALNESYAISRGTRCKQHLFSLSINPPMDQQVSTEEFERTIARAEERLGLTGQPRAIVFHEKEGRRHAHAVWSRIKAEEMKAVQLSHTKFKLVDLSRELYLEHGWKMPRGMMRSSERDMRNFSLEEWQQAKRSNTDPNSVREAISECWAVSDSRAAFAQALESRGFKLARGDRRGYVAVDMHGNPFAVAKYAGTRTKDVRARVGLEDDHLPSVEQCRQLFSAEIAARLKELRSEEERKAQQERERRDAERKALVERQRVERMRHADAIKLRWDKETAERQQRFNRGVRGLIDRISGRYGRVRDQNIAEAYQAMMRDRREKDAVIFRHLEERRSIDGQRRDALRAIRERQKELDADIQRRAPSTDPVREAMHDRTAPSRALPDVPMPEPPSAQQLRETLSDREARRAEFRARRGAQAVERQRSRGPRRDLDR